MKKNFSFLQIAMFFSKEQTKNKSCLFPLEQLAIMLAITTAAIEKESH